MKLRHPKKTCAECPWKKTSVIGKFPPETYEALTVTAQDMKMNLFACHMTPEGREHTCAGFILQQGMHNMRVRLALLKGGLDPSTIEADGPLYANYREMAIANGVSPDAECLIGVRDDGQIVLDE